jgi:hypothetical protein
VTTPTLPRRKLRPNRLPMGAARWLLGRDPELTDNGGVRHGSIVRWRHLIVHKSGLEDWHAFLAQFWAEHRAAVLDWHAARGFAIPARRLGHEAERAFLRRSRKRGRAKRRQSASDRAAASPEGRGAAFDDRAMAAINTQRAGLSIARVRLQITKERLRGERSRIHNQRGSR